MTDSSKVVIIGSGIGGLSCALSLASQGIETLIIEKNNLIGGKMRQIWVDNQPIDAGPTVITMKWVFEQLFEKSQAKLEEYVQLEQASILARHIWRDKSQLDLFSDTQKSFTAIKDFSNEENSQGFIDYLKYATKIYQTVEGPFIRNQKPTAFSIWKKYHYDALPLFFRAQGHKKMWSSLQTFFTDQRLIQLFARYATYTGSSPFLCPATLNLIPHVETEGVWRAKGGMYALLKALKTRFCELGGKIIVNKNIHKLHTKHQKITKIETTQGQFFHAKAFVFNGDIAALPALLNPQTKTSPENDFKSRSLSALTWCMIAKTKNLSLRHHNVFFSNQYRKEFEEIFSQKKLPTVPTTYICAQDRGDQEIKLEKERLLILVNAPAVGDFNPKNTQALHTKNIEQLKKRTCEHLQHSGLEISTDDEKIVQTSPSEWNHLFPHTGGALYGKHSHKITSSFKRKGARTPFENLFLAGGSVHPGAGIPMASLSGQLAAEELCKTLPFA